MGRKRRSLAYRTASQRVRKWDAKVKGDVYAMILEDVKPLALERFAPYQVTHEWLISLVKNIIGKYGFDHQITQEYMWYAQRLWYLTQRYRSKALQLESDAIFVYYVYRGRSETILREIASALGIKISSWDNIYRRLGMSEEIIYRGTKRALKETLERVATDTTDVDITYDAEGRIKEITKYDKVTGTKKKITLEYDAEGRLIKKIEEWVT